KGDRRFLQQVFHKLLLNFTWWVNRKDTEGKNIFQGGFLGLDNIGVFDRSSPLPTGGHIEQSDGTSWMAMYTLNLLTIALELAREDPAYEDVASKFWEHFLYIAHAMNNLGEDGVRMLHEEEGFYYGVRHRGAVAVPPRPSLYDPCKWDGASCGLRAGGIRHRPVRRQLQLARADLVPRQLSDHRVAAKIPSLPRRRLYGGMPDRVRPDD